jgi:hypothetical protein
MEFKTTIQLKNQKQSRIQQVSSDMGNLTYMNTLVTDRRPTRPCDDRDSKHFLLLHG